MPLDVDAVTSPRYMREPLSLSLHLIEVSHISIRKSSITLRCFNKSCFPFGLHLQKYKISGNLRRKDVKIINFCAILGQIDTGFRNIRYICT